MESAAQPPRLGSRASTRTSYPARGRIPTEATAKTLESCDEDPAPSDLVRRGPADEQQADMQSV